MASQVGGVQPLTSSMRRSGERWGPSTSPQEAEEEKRSSRTGLFALFMLLGAAGVMAAIGIGTPILVEGWRPWHLAGAAALTLLAAGAAWWALPRVTKRIAAAVSALCVLLIAAFVAGAFTSVVIEGEVYLTTSDTAQAYRISNELLDDLEYMKDADRLLAADQTEGRALYREYEPAQKRLTEISRKWSRLSAEPENLPSANLAAVARNVAVATDWHARALERKAQILVEPDARGEADVASYRASGVQAFSLAGVQLGEIAQLYGFELGVQE